MEPGVDAPPGRLIVVRDQGRLRLARQPRSPGQPPVLADPGVLPYPLPSATRVGRVLAVLPEPGESRAASSDVLELLDRALAWERQVARSHALAPRAAVAANVRRLKALAACIEALDPGPVRAALAAEARRTLAAIERLVRRSSKAFEQGGKRAAREASAGSPAPRRGWRPPAQRTKSSPQGVDRSVLEVI